MEIKTVKVVRNFVCEKCGSSWNFCCEIPEDFILNIKFQFCDSCAEKKERQKDVEKTDEILASRADVADIPELFRNWNSKIGKKQILDWVLANSNKNLFISGNFGCGKTSATAHAAFLELKKNRSVFFCNFGDLADLVAAGADEKNKLGSVISKMLSAELLIIDDICPRLVMSDAVGNVLRKIIDNWYRRGDNMRLWITSNMNSRQIEEKFENRDDGKRVIGRISRVINSGRMAVLAV